MFPLVIFILFFIVLVLGFAHRRGYDIGGILAIVCVVAVEAVEFYTFCMLFPGNSMAGPTFSVASGYIGPQVTPTSCYGMPAILPVAYARGHVPLDEMARTLAAYPAATYTPVTAPIMEVSTASQQEMSHWATSFEATPTPTPTPMVVGGSRDISALSRSPWHAAIVVLGLASIYTLAIGVWMWKARCQEMAMSRPRRVIFAVGAALPAPPPSTSTPASLSIGSDGSTANNGTTIANDDSNTNNANNIDSSTAGTASTANSIAIPDCSSTNTASDCSSTANNIDSSTAGTASTANTIAIPDCSSTNTASDCSSTANNIDSTITILDCSSITTTRSISTEESEDGDSISFMCQFGPMSSTLSLVGSGFEDDFVMANGLEALPSPLRFSDSLVSSPKHVMLYLIPVLRKCNEWRTMQIDRSSFEFEQHTAEYCCTPSSASVETKKLSWLSFKAHKITSLEDGLRQFAAREAIGRANISKCSVCDSVKFGRQTRVKRFCSLPQFLATHISHSKGLFHTKRSSQRVSFPMELDMKPFASARPLPTAYSLFLVVARSSEGGHKGNFTRFARSSRNVWYVCNFDGSSAIVSKDTVLAANAYALVYSRTPQA